MRRVVGRLVGASAGASLATVAALRVADANSRASSSDEIKYLCQTHSQQPFDAASSIAERGVTILHGVLSTEIQLDPRLDAASIAASAGAAMAAMLPTVHQADAWVRQSMGQQFGQRAAAFALSQQEEPTLAGCQQAVAQLQEHAARPCPCAAPPMKALLLKGSWLQSSELDALDEALAQATANTSFDTAAEDNEDAETPLLRVSPTASRLRGWAAVLMAPASRWAASLDACAMQPGRERRLEQHRVMLLVAEDPLYVPSSKPADSDRSVEEMMLAMLRSARWPKVGLSDGVTVLLPLPMSAKGVETTADAAAAPTQSSSVCVDVLLPIEEVLARRLPSVRLRVPAGSALVLDGRVRWQLVDGGQQPEPVVLFEYRDASATKPGIVEVARARFAEGASVAVRAALAVALGPPS